MATVPPLARRASRAWRARQISRRASGGPPRSSSSCARSRRRATIDVSAAGWSLLERAPLAPTADLLAGLERLADQDLAALAAGLTRLTDAMGLVGEPTEMLFADGPDDRGRRGPSATRQRSLSVLALGSSARGRTTPTRWTSVRRPPRSHHRMRP